MDTIYTRISSLWFLTMALFVINLSSTFGQKIPTPKEHFGFTIGDDYHLATYTQTETYFKKLAAASPRANLVDMGLTEEGRHQYMLVVSSPENLKDLAKYKAISQQLARAEGLTDEQARAQAKAGKAVVWIDGGLHATETVGAHQLIETAYQLVSRQDAETKRILDDVIILMAHANPDGQELVSDWYMREKKDEKKSTDFLPRLYQKYIGHDNNRDFFMMNMSESWNIGRQLYVEWIPQIVYNHHQSGPAGTVVAGPPYRDPFNYVYDPLIITSLDAVGAAMNSRLNAENKPGYTQRAGSVYSTWWNGGLRTAPYFHNMIGILTEIIGSPTPDTIPLVPHRLIPNGSQTFPIAPQVWHFRQSIDYSVSLNYAVLNHASRMRDELLFNAYRMGKNAIERGQRDYWALSPKRIKEIEESYAEAKKKNSKLKLTEAFYDSVMTDPALRDPRAYILSASQSDFPTATKFVNALIKSGVQVHRATADFTVDKKKYPKGSYVVMTAQAFRPHVLDMFEPQDHPNDFQYPGGPPVRPYDAAGWTLAYQMGVQFDRILNDLKGPFQPIPYGELQHPAGTFEAVNPLAGYLLNPETNDSFTAVNDLLKANVDVFRTTEPSDLALGTFFVPAGEQAKAMLGKVSNDLGIHVQGVKQRPTVPMVKVEPLRVGLWDNYGGSMPSGWVRWLSEQFHFPVEVVYAPTLDAGDLRKKFDVLLFVTSAIPAPPGGETGRYRSQRMPKANDIPKEYRDQLGRISVDTTITELKKFLEAGGTVLTIGSSTNLAYHLKLPVRNKLVEINSDGKETRLPSEKYYIPGSILRVSVDSTRAISWGMPSQADVYFENSPVFDVAPDALARGDIKPILWFDTATPLRSGWAWGQSYLQGGVTGFEAKVGAGKLYAFGPEITFRAQSHGTLKLVFNALYSTGTTVGGAD
ncbi:M14 family metallopeptidase [Persicitalea jodogahamensis]|uniref:Peptidase n=1 Tax=Persicitalea jodogahamensis TaxID=402147 RepID=A0A8J3D2U5_9BACT|nr:M14 metallopeptidase family protein [Persicitalea jodogahamensis]GHB61389.1 peptidase [Persicitalea jodogahamensis]